MVAYGGKLDIRPPYQREFIYKDKQRDAVIDSVRKDFPLNVMYWAVREDGNYEVIDGQQRTLSVCQYVNGDFSINGLAFHNLQDDQQHQILDYKLMIYFCSGTDSEKLDWFSQSNSHCSNSLSLIIKFPTCYSSCIQSHINIFHPINHCND